MFAAYLESNFGKNLEVLRVKIHDYLGMVLDYSKTIYSKMSMTPCLLWDVARAHSHAS